MKITIASKWAHPWNGMCQVAHRLATGLLDRGHEVAWVANRGEVDENWVDDRVQIERKPRSPISGKRFSRQHISEFAPDLVHAHDSQGLYFSNFSVPLLMTSHSNWPRSWILDVKSFFSGIFVEAPQDITMRKANKVVAVSDYSSKWLSRRGISSSTIYNGVDVWDDAETPRDGFAAIGTVDNRKYKHLPQIWKKIHTRTQAELNVVGKIVSSELAKDLRSLEGVTVHGEVPAIEPYYKTNATLLFPSRAEACPLTVLEAQAHGMPVVAWDVCSHRELIGQNTGEAVEPYNINKFAETAIETHNNRIPQACSEWIHNHFDSEQMVNEYIIEYRSII